MRLPGLRLIEPRAELGLAPNAIVTWGHQHHIADQTGQSRRVAYWQYRPTSSFRGARQGVERLLAEHIKAIGASITDSPPASKFATSNRSVVVVAVALALLLFAWY